MSGEWHLHWSLGPVQGFVAEARRARDLWAGSFLLSWLALRAAIALEDADGTILRPLGLKEDEGYKALRAGGGEAPCRATVPNRLTAAFATDDAARQAAGAARAAVLKRWQGLAEKVRLEFLNGVLGSGQQAIWDAAIEPPNRLWEIQWVVVPAGEDGQKVLDRRKLWRDFDTFSPELAGGDRCRLMHDWPELSGASRATQPGKRAQEAFWKKVHKAYDDATGDGEGGRKLELRDGERLSAPAFVKRFFPRLTRPALEEAIGWRPDDLPTTSGRWRPSYMPSTAYMAAVHWLARAARLARGTCDELADLVEKKAPALGLAERETGLAALAFDAAAKVRRVDGSLFFAETVANAREIGLSPEVARKVVELLNRLHRVVDPADDKPLGIPSPYYAILRMDGDEMGRRMASNLKLAEALSAFAGGSREIVERHSGRLLYAGGDDLLALLPLEEAIAAALALEAWFRQCTVPIDADATISAGLVFAHQNAPLRGAMAESARLLEAVAKEVNGRASLAVSVFRVGGPAFEWATTWRDRDGFDPVTILQDQLARLYFAKQPTRALASNRLTYAMRDRLGPFFTTPGTRRADIVREPAEMDVTPETIAALIRTAGGEALKQTADADTVLLLDVAVTRYRQQDDTGGAHLVRRCEAERCLDLVLLFRFLGSQWRKR